MASRIGRKRVSPSIAGNGSKCSALIRAASLGSAVAVGSWILSDTSAFAASTPTSTSTSTKSGMAKDMAPVSSATRTVSSSTTQSLLTQDQKIVHVLNRLAFGPRPGDVEAVKRIGISAWIDQQLSPNSIDDSAVTRKLQGFHTLSYSVQQLLVAYENDQLLQRLKREERKTRLASAKGETFTPKIAELNAHQNRVLEEGRTAGFEEGISMQIVGEMQSAKLLRALESKRQLQEVLTDFWSNHFNIDVKKKAVRTLRLADERDVIRPNVLGRFRDMLGASAHSPAMLIYLDNASSSVSTTVKNPNKNKKKRLLNTNAKLATNPEMTPEQAAASDDTTTPQRRRQAQLAAQTNATTSAVTASSATTSDATNADAANAASSTVATPILPDVPKTRGGVNENYARELMELHTLGVGGGYTQKDVQEVARCFTGWSIDREAGGFRFYPMRHDDGAKTVLGHEIPAGGGETDGERVLDILASQPATARFIVNKMCKRLVSDAPPAALVERVAQVFLKTGGDLKAVTKAIVTSPEFMSPQSFRTKIKSPFEYSISAARALDATYIVPDTSDASERRMLVMAGGVSASAKERYAKQAANKALGRQIGLMGEPLYSFQAPTGYSENSQDWVSSGALIARLNFALDLTNGRISDLKISRDTLFRGLDKTNKTAWLARLEELTLQGDVSAATKKTLQAQIAPGAPFDAAKIGALLLGSPEFQRR